MKLRGSPALNRRRAKAVGQQHEMQIIILGLITELQRSAAALLKRHREERGSRKSCEVRFCPPRTCKHFATHTHGIMPACSVEVAAAQIQLACLPQCHSLGCRHAIQVGTRSLILLRGIRVFACKCNEGHGDFSGRSRPSTGACVDTHRSVCTAAKVHMTAAGVWRARN